MFLKNIFCVWKKELKSYFYTPLASVFIGVFIVAMGYMFYSFLRLYLMLTQGGPYGMPQEIGIDRLAESFYANMNVIFLFVLPFFSMGLFTEELRKNTLVLLMTSPIRNWEITLAKYLSALSILSIMLLLSLVFPAFLVLYSEGGAAGGPDLGIIFTSYLGLFLNGAMFLAIGLFWSALLRSQLMALIFTFASNFGLWMMSSSAQGAGGQGAADSANMLQHFQNFLQGSLELKSLVFFLSIIFFALFLSNKVLESRAWRS